MAHAQAFDLTSTSSVRIYTEQQASHLGVDPRLASAIEGCESSYNAFATGTVQTVGYRDIGPMQINEHYQGAAAKAQGFDIYDPKQNILFGLLLMKQIGTGPWSASKSCWGKINT